MRLIDPNSAHVKNAALAWNQNMRYNILDNLKNMAIQNELNYQRSRKQLDDIKPTDIRVSKILLVESFFLIYLF